ncbi:MAG: TOBE domain-containing protein, partial [Deltaproteobacteria bacterium]|nr:TOBE domain-containing protein [Deltaproteobacteria bacterium]
SAVADRIAIMDSGCLVQVGTLEEVKAQPKNAFVARFLKTQNLFPAVADGATVRVTDNIQLEKKSSIQGEMVMAIRPENIRIYPDTDSGRPNSFRGAVIEAVPRPHFMEYTVDVGLKLTVFQIAERKYQVGEAVTVQVPAEHIALVEKD